MIPLINKFDSEIMKDMDFVKNASFYKDMLAFYDAYLAISSRSRNDLPNFCFLNNRLFLDGVCLLIKDCASEFAFSTLNLTLDYLKILYFGMAGYSKDGNLPDKNDIVSDFLNHKDACLAVTEKSREILNRNETINTEILSKCQMQEQAVKKTQRKEKSASKFLIFSGIGIIVAIALFIIGYFAFQSNIVLIAVVSASLLLMFVLLMIVALKKKKKLKNALVEQNLKLNNLLKEKDNSTQTLENDKNKLNKLLSEYYEYNSNFADAMLDKTKRNIYVIFKKMSENKFLSYNLKYDIMMTAKRQEEEIKNLLTSLEEKNCNLSEIYNKILEKNWLYYNSFVRYGFLSKFIESAYKSHIWTVQVDDRKLNPFEIDVKSVAKEKVAFLPKDKNKLFGLYIDNILNSNIASKNKISNFSEAKTIEELRKMKISYSKRFFDYQEVSKVEGLVYDSGASKSNKKIDLGSFESYSKLPLVIELDEKLAVAKLGGENSESNLVKKTVEEILANVKEDLVEDSQNIFPEIVIDEYSYIPFEDDFESVEDIDEETVRFKYNNGKDFIGFKI